MSFHELPVLAGGLRIVDVAARPRRARADDRERTVRVPPFRTWARVFVIRSLDCDTRSLSRGARRCSAKSARATSKDVKAES